MYQLYAATDGQYYEDIKNKVESWFEIVKEIAKAESPSMQ